MEWLEQSVPVFMLMFCRITAFFVVAPVYSSRTVPTTHKLGLSFIVTLLVYLSFGLSQTVTDNMSYILLILQEVLIGLLLGFTAYLMFAVVQTAGALIDIQIGFAMANVIDPVSGVSSPLIGNFKYMLAILVFLSMNGHHYLLDAIMYSYEWVPVTGNVFFKFEDGSTSEFLIKTFSYSFALALQMSAPIVVSLFLTDLGLGFLARTAPQFNVFVIGIIVKILVGLGMLFLLMPGMVTLFDHLFDKLFRALQGLLGVLGQRPE
ncbi:flagellar type III secretion system protein FliR [Paenibacillus sp. F411]|uniref:Flagellar biosynthetic protein FliR n=1 Tax=Paenibacillus algicola TaxID=2565926 RepID=A0A4P8XKH0_9BACL|nr:MULTISPECIES: flagellar biosynthetic protein FliR [Paenibacillus]MBO2945741.1 flagellar type III secretion system protein FliR [Paenibacillus sp. F411]QCT03207.1 flagellar biosynthetic protein FliR [Paenibacillus algicola]